MSRHTVTSFVKRIYRKLQVHSKTEAVYEARRMGFLADKIVFAGVGKTVPEMVLALERAALFGQFESTGWRQRKDSSRFWGHTVLTALREAGTGRALGFSALTRDMTEVRRLQELLQDLNQTLEVRVQERTRQLLEANRDLESFSSSVSHDLRAPLRHIGSFIAILQEHLGEQADPTTAKHLKTIADAAQRMGALIEGLLAFSRLGLAPLEKREVGMATQVSASTPGANTAIKRHGICPPPNSSIVATLKYR